MASLKRHWIHCVLAIAMSVISLGLVACNSELGLHGPAAVPNGGDKAKPTQVAAIPYDQETLVYLWDGSNHNDWDIISGVIDPAVGGRITGIPASWPNTKDYVFGFFFPPGAIRGTELVTISMRIPRYTEGNPYTPVMHLEPHGMVFNAPVVVQFCYPPWLQSDDSYGRFCLQDEIRGGEPWYFVTDYAKVLPSEDDEQLGIQFQTTHFSRWGMQNGSGGEEGMIYGGPEDPPTISR